MSKSYYTANLSRTQGRNTYAIVFRHPKRPDLATGKKEGLRVRQSLKTENEREATGLKDQMNTLLSSPEFWDLGAREKAASIFDARVVDIFYYKFEGEDTNFLDLREKVISLPSSESSDYRRALFLGTTGAGKTTLLRQIIGTDPVRERFPSTSKSKTTVHETEVVMADGSFRAVVTFFPVEEIREHLKDCVSKAVLAAYREESDSDQMRKMLTHVNQKFRFNYVLGNGPIKESDDFDDEPDSDGSEDDNLKRTNTVLLSALASIKEIALRYGELLREELTETEENDQRVIDEMFEEALDRRAHKDESFQQVVDALMDEIENRFTLLTEGKLQKTKVGWPLTWTFESDDRQKFIDSISRFASNYAPLFGSLLTPLVNGLRVSGPFFPSWTSEQPKLVLFDGEGLGHTVGSMSTISTTLSDRIDMVDAIVLVDRSPQPMLADTISAMKELASSGAASKLIFAFTHFDEMDADNLPTPAARSRHVLESAEQVLSAVGEDLGPYAERILRSRLTNARVFLERLDTTLDIGTEEGKRAASQLNKLLRMIDGIVERRDPSESRPVYDRMLLGLNVERAAESFHDGWRARLGLSAKPGVKKEHWTRIKALSRHITIMGKDHYDSLQPVADLRYLLRTRLYVFLQNPIEWKGSEPSDDDKQKIFDAIAGDLNRRLLVLAAKRVKSERLSEWRIAYDESGPRSTFRRARLIAEQIYDAAAPVPDVTPIPDRNEFLRIVAELTRESVESFGAELR